jgi:GDP-L-fucose synthase
VNERSGHTSGPAMPRRVFVAGHGGMVGSALLRKLKADPEVELLTRSHAGLDLSRQSEVEQFFADESIDQVFLAAAKVGGILANRDYPGDFIRENLQIQTNVIHSAHQAGVSRLLFLGSSCIYPRLAPQPITEDALLSGPLEPTNEAYAVAKIAGIRMCEAYHRQFGSDFRSVMPTNLYGPNDNFDLQSGHVLPALLSKFHTAVEAGHAETVVWGSGSPRREFLHVDDMAAACCMLMQLEPSRFWSAVPARNAQVNIGCGEDVSIADLAQLIAEVTGFRGAIVFDASKPDGTPRKLLDVSRIRSLGWSAQIPLREGIRQTYAWMCQELADDSPKTGAGKGAI